MEEGIPEYGTWSSPAGCSLRPSADASWSVAPIERFRASHPRKASRFVQGVPAYRTRPERPYNARMETRANHPVGESKSVAEAKTIIIRRRAAVRVAPVPAPIPARGPAAVGGGGPSNPENNFVAGPDRGNRRGAGARKGNANARTHGLHSGACKALALRVRDWKR